VPGMGGYASDAQDPADSDVAADALREAAAE